MAQILLYCLLSTLFVFQFDFVQEVNCSLTLVPADNLTDVMNSYIFEQCLVPEINQ